MVRKLNISPSFKSFSKTNYGETYPFWKMTISWRHYNFNSKLRENYCYSRRKRNWYSSCVHLTFYTFSDLVILTVSTEKFSRTPLPSGSMLPCLNLSRSWFNFISGDNGIHDLATYIFSDRVLITKQSVWVDVTVMLPT